MDWVPLGKVLDSSLHVGAVSSSDSVLTVARWKVLHIVEFLSLHGDVLAKILITVHASGKLSELSVWHARHTFDARVHARVELNQTSSRLKSFGPGWVVEEWRSIGNSERRGDAEEGSKN